MRQLTFAGYLKSYVPSLAGQRTQGMSRLAQAAHTNSRVVEPLLLLAVTTDRAEQLAGSLKDMPDLRTELSLLVTLAQKNELEAALAAEDPRLRAEYAKVWRSFVARRDAGQRDKRLKQTARARVLALESQKHVTRYRMAKDLGLNPGNLHAFLTQGNVSKLSLEHAYQLVEYLRAA